MCTRCWVEVYLEKPQFRPNQPWTLNWIISSNRVFSEQYCLCLKPRERWGEHNLNLNPLERLNVLLVAVFLWQTFSEATGDSDVQEVSWHWELSAERVFYVKVEDRCLSTVRARVRKRAEDVPLSEEFKEARADEGPSLPLGAGHVMFS